MRPTAADLREPESHGQANRSELGLRSFSDKIDNSIRPWGCVYSTNIQWFWLVWWRSGSGTHVRPISDSLSSINAKSPIHPPTKRSSPDGPPQIWLLVSIVALFTGNHVVSLDLYSLCKFSLGLIYLWIWIICLFNWLVYDTTIQRTRVKKQHYNCLLSRMLSYVIWF